MTLKYYFEKEETLGYDLIIKIPGDKFSIVEKFENYSDAFSRYSWLETDCRNLLLSLNEVKSVTKVTNWSEEN